MTGADPIGITWQPTSVHGWGVFGINLAHQMALGGRHLPVFIGKIDAGLIDLDPEQKAVLDLVLQFSIDFRQKLDAIGADAAVNFPVLVSLGENFVAEPHPPSSVAEHGILFLTDTEITTDAVGHARRFHTIVAGASWTEDILRGYGIPL